MTEGLCMYLQMANRLENNIKDGFAQLAGRKDMD